MDEIILLDNENLLAAAMEYAREKSRGCAVSQNYLKRHVKLAGQEISASNVYFVYTKHKPTRFSTTTLLKAVKF